jgi:hypothetical protein
MEEERAMTRRLPWPALLVSLAGCGGMTDSLEEQRVPPTGTVTVESALRVDSTVRVHVANGTLSPVFVYTEALGSHLDDATKRLTLVMHEVPTPPNGSSADCHVHVPSLQTIPALSTADIDVRANFPAASSVRVELGWSDQKIALDRSQVSLCRFDAETALKVLERGVAVGVFELPSE